MNAEILQMERGTDKRISKRKRIEPRKKENEKKNTKELKSKIGDKEAEIENVKIEEVKKENQVLREILEKTLIQTKQNGTADDCSVSLDPI